MKWEYMELRDCYIQDLNVLGAKGWELIAVYKGDVRPLEYGTTSDVYFYFKRLLKEEHNKEFY